MLRFILDHLMRIIVEQAKRFPFLSALQKEIRNRYTTRRKEAVDSHAPREDEHVTELPFPLEQNLI